MKHIIKKSYMYITENKKTKIYNVNYNLKEILDLINDYSIKNGSTLIKKRSLNRISNYENGRVIEESVKKTTQEQNSNNKSKPSRLYTYKILENESKFITTLLNSFESYPFVIYGEPYILINFSKIYDMLINNELSESDILFMQIILKELDIKINRTCVQKHDIPNKVTTKVEDGIKNINLINEVRNYKKHEPFKLIKKSNS